MLVNEGTYLINSLGEKYIFSDKFILRWIDKGGVTDMIAKLGTIEEAIKTQEEQAEEELGAEDEEVIGEDGGEEDGGDSCG